LGAELLAAPIGAAQALADDEGGARRVESVFTAGAGLGAGNVPPVIARCRRRPPACCRIVKQAVGMPAVPHQRGCKHELEPECAEGHDAAALVAVLTVRDALRQSDAGLFAAQAESAGVAQLAGGPL
jgi:hypothetical protein